MIHAAHIVSDRKFLPWIKEVFNIPGWDNSFIVLIYRKKKEKKKISENEIEISIDKSGLQHVIQLLDDKDVAFHYFLDFPKTEITLKSQPHILHYWFFFGAEIYQQTNFFKKDLYGPATKAILKYLPEIYFRYQLRSLYYRYILRSKTSIENFEKAVPKIRNILWYIQDEIEWIGKRVSLPPYLFMQFFTFQSIIPDEDARTNQLSKRILIGNSATISNNHFDVLKVLSDLKTSDHSYSIPLTYGQFPRYRSKLKKSFQAVLAEKVFFLDHHMKLEEYYSFLNAHPTAIFLNYRQQGLGNIFYLLYNGTKVYLSERNIIYHWLKKNHIVVHDFEKEFISDYNHERLILDSETMMANRIHVKKLLLHNKNLESIKLIETELYSRKQERIK